MGARWGRGPSFPAHRVNAGRLYWGPDWPASTRSGNNTGARCLLSPPTASNRRGIGRQITLHPPERAACLMQAIGAVGVGHHLGCQWLHHADSKSAGMRNFRGRREPTRDRPLQSRSYGAGAHPKSLFRDEIVKNVPLRSLRQSAVAGLGQRPSPPHNWQR